MKVGDVVRLKSLRDESFPSDLFKKWHHSSGQEMVINQMFTCDDTGEKVASIYHTTSDGFTRTNFITVKCLEPIPVFKEDKPKKNIEQGDSTNANNP